MNRAGWKVAVGLEVAADGDEDPGALDAVEEHRAVPFSEDVLPDLDDERLPR